MYKQGKNEEEWTVRMKDIFIGDWIYKCVSYYILTETAKINDLGILEHNK